MGDNEDLGRPTYFSERRKKGKRKSSHRKSQDGTDKLDLKASFKSQRKFSVTELLKMQTQNYSHLFPLIDTHTYQSKAQTAIYNTEEMLTSEEILPYFGSSSGKAISFQGVNNISDMRTSVASTPSVDEVFYTATAGDVNPTAEHMEKLIPEEQEITFLEKIHARCARIARSDPTMTSLVLRRRSTPMLVMETMTPTLHPNLPMKYNLQNSVWFGCIIDYMVITRRLNVRVVHSGDVFDEVFDGKGAKLLAKVFLLPGEIQKQRIPVKRAQNMSLKRVSFEKFSGPELHQMEIGIKLMVRRGIFKRPQLLNEWTIPLEGVNLIGEQTAWKLFELRK